MRAVLVRLETPWRRALVLALVLAGAAWLARGVAARAAAAAVASRSATAAGLERAAAQDPGNPDIRLRLAEASLAAPEAVGPGAARRHAEAALAGRPTHGATWLALARLADREGDRDRARRALATALRYDRHSVSLRWEAALLALRWGDRDPALEHLRYVIEVDPQRRDAAFHLARVLLPDGEPVAALLPRDAGPLDAILQLAVRDGDLDLARTAWARRAALGAPADEGLARRYLDLLVARGDGRAARRLWLAMAPGGDPAPGDAVWNGGFEAPRLGGFGFDWEVRRVWGVEVRLDRAVAAEGRQALRLAFNSHPTLDFAGVSQLVAVEPGVEYRLTARARAQDLATRSGVRLEVTAAEGDPVLAATGAVSGTTGGWVALEAQVRAPAGASLLRLRVRRERAPGPEGSLWGRVWVDDVRLVPVEGKEGKGA